MRFIWQSVHRLVRAKAGQETLSFLVVLHPISTDNGYICAHTQHDIGMWILSGIERSSTARKRLLMPTCSSQATRLQPKKRKNQVQARAPGSMLRGSVAEAPH
ncbi:MAG: hypothetical protein FRX49_03491 [Trebouxia sp. A1-2]|nr:MAG: hypothetical protein FRX49_03491 [Trebouxia sp. A1-2]